MVLTCDFKDVNFARIKSLIIYGKPLKCARAFLYFHDSTWPNIPKKQLSLAHMWSGENVWRNKGNTRGCGELNTRGCEKSYRLVDIHTCFVIVSSCLVLYF